MQNKNENLTMCDGAQGEQNQEALVMSYLVTCGKSARMLIDDVTVIADWSIIVLKHESKKRGSEIKSITR